MLFKFTSFISLALLLAVATIAYLITIQVRAADVLHYQTITENSQSLRKKNPLAGKTVTQTRAAVRKNIYHDRNYRISSDSSKLTISQESAIEHMEPFTATLEQNTLTADVGIYDYERSFLWTKGNCRLQSGENYILGTEGQWDLEKRKLIYENPQGFYKQENLVFGADQLEWDTAQEKVHLREHVTLQVEKQYKIEANEGCFVLQDNKEPLFLTLTGSVRIESLSDIEKKTYGASEVMIYDCKEKTCTFSGKKDVVFWQQGVIMSAPKIRIKEDNSIEGYGIVHCTFESNL